MPNRKWGGRCEQAFHGRRGLNANHDWKMCSTSLALRGMQMKTIENQHFIQTRSAKGRRLARFHPEVQPTKSLTLEGAKQNSFGRHPSPIWWGWISGTRTSSSSEPTSRTAHAGVSKDLRKRALRSLAAVTRNQKQQTATENTTETQPHSGKLYNRVQLMNDSKDKRPHGQYETECGLRLSKSDDKYNWTMCSLGNMCMWYNWP